MRAGALEVQIRRRVHAGLTLDVAFDLGLECGILFGPSGSGKSTILRLIAGLEPPDSGFVRLGGRTLHDHASGVRLPLRSRGVGLIFQDDLLFPHLDVEGNVRFGLRGWPEGEARARLAAVASLCGIGRLLGRRAGSLSGGERQRVGLARALAPRPRLLLCDEPVSALDLDARHALIDRLKAAREAEGIPMLYVTHAPDEAFALGRRLFLLSGGRIVAEGAPLDVLSAAGSARWESIRNVVAAVVQGHDAEARSTLVRVVDGPLLVVPRLDRPAGSSLRLQVRSDEIVLARGAIGSISARNLIDGTVDRVVPRGPEAEVIVRTGGVAWVVGVVASAVEALGLIASTEVRMIIKARSCHVLPEEPP